MSSSMDFSNISDNSSLSTTSTSSSPYIHNQKYLDRYMLEKQKLSQERLGTMENLHIAVVYEKDNQITTPLQYTPHDLCLLLHQNKNNNIKAYLYPNHSYCKEVTSGMDINNVEIDNTALTKTILLRALQNAALKGVTNLQATDMAGIVKILYNILDANVLKNTNMI